MSAAERLDAEMERLRSDVVAGKYDPEAYSRIKRMFRQALAEASGRPTLDTPPPPPKCQVIQAGVKFPFVPVANKVEF